MESRTSAREADAAQEVLETRIRAQRIVPWAHTQILQLKVVRRVRLLEPCEGFTPLAQRGEQRRQLAG